MKRTATEFTLETRKGQLPRRHLGVVGVVPDDQPYLWIGSDTEGCFGTLGKRELRKLRDAIDKALGSNDG